jgi:hypothetical protein
MNRFSFGFVYVLQNELIPDLVKIGRTSKLPEDRANDLFTTGVPKRFDVIFRCLTSHPEALEREVHKQLKDFRYDTNREFFKIPVGIAAHTILKTRQKIDGIEIWTQKSPIYARVGNRMLLSLCPGQVFMLCAFPGIFAREANIIDVWQAHSYVDTLELYFTNDPECTS